MSFDAMRHHQKKVYLPLAIIVTVVFVFFFGAGGGIGNLLRPTPSMTLEDRLIRLGHDLQSSGMLAPPPTDWYEQMVTRERGAFVTDEDQLRKTVREEVQQYVKAYYREMGAKLHYLPVKEAESLGIRVSDEEVGKRIREFVERNWHISPFTDKAYQEELSARSLTLRRFETLIEGRMLRERVNETLLRTAGASEAEQYYAYSRENQQVRVQYFQRTPDEFLAEVKVLPGKAPEKKPAEKKAEAETGAGDKDGGQPAEKKAGEKEDGGKAPDDGKAGADEDRTGTLYEEDLAKLYKDICEGLKKRYEFRESADFEWPAGLAPSYPEFFSEAAAEIEYLAARTDDFRRGLKVTKEEVEKHYEDNKKFFYRKEPPKKDPKAGGKAGPAEPKEEYKPLSEVRKEIEERLLTDKALDAAAIKLREAGREYNAMKPTERPALKDFAEKHKPLRYMTAGPATVEALRREKFLGGSLVKIADLFEAEKRRELKADLTEDRKVADDQGYVALRLLKFTPTALLDFEKAREGFTVRARRNEAWKLARKSIDADRKALAEGKLDPKRVRTSRLLGPGDETCAEVAQGGLAVGEASEPFRYTQLLGPEAEADEARRKKEEAEKEKAGKDAPEKPKPLAERVTKTVDSGAHGYRVVILAERKTPTAERFREDRDWKSAWKPPRIPEWYARFLRQRGQLPGDTRWREMFLADFYARKYERLMSRGE